MKILNWDEFLNEGKGISNIVKDEINNIWDLFLTNSYSENVYKFENKEIKIIFKKQNNYSSNIQSDKYNNVIITIVIPENGKEKRVKENISHELTHLMELLGLNGRDYPKYNNIKKSIIEYNRTFSKNDAMDFILDIFYKTLDNEINANVAQMYIYIKSDGRCSREDAIKRLEENNNYKLYSSIKNIRLDVLEKQLNKNEVNIFNTILYKNGVKTIPSTNLTKWLKYWFKIFKFKSDIFMKNSIRILDEVEKDWMLKEEYIVIDTFEKVNYEPYLEEFDILGWYNQNKGLSDEATSAIGDKIYHFTNNIDKILVDDELKIGDWGFVSFTRNKDLNYGKYRITLDFEKLNSDYKLYNYVYDEGFDQELTLDELKSTLNKIKDEEEVVSKTPIKNLKQYIIQIDDVK